MFGNIVIEVFEEVMDWLWFLYSASKGYRQTSKINLLEIHLWHVFATNLSFTFVTVTIIDTIILNQRSKHVMHIIFTNCRSVNLCRHYYRQSAYIRDLEQPGIMLTYLQGLIPADFFWHNCLVFVFAVVYQVCYNVLILINEFEWMNEWMNEYVNMHHLWWSL